MENNMINNYLISLLNYTEENNNQVKYFKDFDVNIRLFRDEIIYAKNKYCVSGNESSFFYSLLDFLQYETNVLVDGDGIPLNQMGLAEKLNIDRKTVQRNISELINKHFIYSFKNGRDIYYIVNPHMVFSGLYLDLNIPTLFYIDGYEPLNKLEIPNKINILNMNNSQFNINNDRVKKNVYGNICFAEDGAKCLSVQEKTIHEFMLQYNLKILSKEEYYKNIIENETLKGICGKMRCDWIIEINNKKYIVEYFGMIKDLAYKVKHDLKIKLIKLDNKESLFIPIYPDDLNNLNKIFAKYLR